MVVLGFLPCHLSSFHPPTTAESPKSNGLRSTVYASSDLPKRVLIRRRESIVVASSSILAALLPVGPTSNPSFQNAKAEEDEFQRDEERVVQIFQGTSPSVVFIKDIQIVDPRKRTGQIDVDEDENTRVEGTGSGFLWDKTGHIVTNYHVVDKLATDTRGVQRCKVFLIDANGNTFSKEGKLVGSDPAYDLAVLKVDVEGNKLKPAVIGTSRDLRVGQSCFAIGNPYGYEHTLTTGVVSGLGREIPSPNGRAIRGAIQTDAAINAGTGASSGVNFAIPIDTVVRTVPYLIVYGTSVSNRF
ncbi:protease Do-like 5, chloroplastic isoform X2 [Magnolia sinica]|uniref:protease Do-like 5, chloroplastic isoform X2 n=1 Tax=Magnolia sinica TaxID=86752 RepID=UPI002658BDDA|nr:protease Do-like 5, chloroplastic isoform X2 [Magnolia sinica]